MKTFLVKINFQATQLDSTELKWAIIKHLKIPSFLWELINIEEQKEEKENAG